MIEVPAFPLSWPRHVKRRPYRQRARFGRNLTVHRAVQDLREEVRRLGGRYLTVSSNIPVRLDGWPSGSAGRPSDPAVAVYFQLDGKPHCMPCDAWDTVEANLRAITLHIEALRGIARWGVQTVEQAFSGFAALPAPGADWRSVLELQGEQVTPERVEARYRDLAKVRHPDVGGSQDAFVRLQEARRRALEELGA